MLVLDLIREGQAERSRPRQSVTHGTVIGADRGHYQVVSGGLTYSCRSGIAAGLKAGDRVWLVMGGGNPKIIGLLGQDAGVP